MRFQPKVLQRLCRFQAEQSAADHGSHLRPGRLGGDNLQIFDGAVDEAVAPVAARYRRHEGAGARGEYQLVVGHFFVARRANHLLHRIDGKHAVVQAQCETVLLEKIVRHDIQICRALAGEKARQLHPVVGRARLLAEHGDLAVSAAFLGMRNQLLQEALADHAVADDGDSHQAALALNSAAARISPVFAKRTTSPTTISAGPLNPAAESAPSVATLCFWL